MRRPILAGADAGVGSDVNLLETLEGCHSNSRSGVEVKHEEGACHGDECALVERSETVGNGTHGVLADAVVDVAATIVSVQTTSSSKIGLVVR